jgi:hypothetical protein
MKLLRVVPALYALILSAVTVAGCGIGSGGAVATVDGEPTGEDEYERLREQVLQMLVSHRWLEGEAEDRGIAVSESEVDAAFERQRKERFRNDAAFEKNKARFGQPERRDLRIVLTKTEAEAKRVRQMLVAERRQQALDDFVAGFRRTWRARTECDEEYETQECNR